MRTKVLPRQSHESIRFPRRTPACTALLDHAYAAPEEIDVFVSPSFQGDTLGITNLTGHSCVCVPNAFRSATSEEGEPDPPDYRKQPGSIAFVGALYRDDAALRLAHAYQEETNFDKRRPPVR